MGTETPDRPGLRFSDVFLSAVQERGLEAAAADPSIFREPVAYAGALAFYADALTLSPNLGGVTVALTLRQAVRDYRRATAAQLEEWARGNPADGQQPDADAWAELNRRDVPAPKPAPAPQNCRCLPLPGFDSALDMLAHVAGFDGGGVHPGADYIPPPFRAGWYGLEGLPHIRPFWRDRAEGLEAGAKRLSAQPVGAPYPFRAIVQGLEYTASGVMLLDLKADRAYLEGVRALAYLEALAVGDPLRLEGLPTPATLYASPRIEGPWAGFTVALPAATPADRRAVMAWLEPARLTAAESARERLLGSRPEWYYPPAPVGVIVEGLE